MAGDETCQVLFYHLATFIWKQNDLSGYQVNRLQTILITKMFGISDIGDFMNKVNGTILVPTWDGKTRVWMTDAQVKRMHQEICMLGPMAAMFGREVQQILMVTKDIKHIDMAEFQNSVDSGRVSFGQQIADQQSEAADMHVDDDLVSQSSKRTRSPRRALYRDVRSQEEDHRSANLSAPPSYIRDR